VMSTKRELSRLHEQSQFVFRGRVAKFGASNVRHIASTPETATVMVEEVLRGNDFLHTLVGKEITVVLGGSNTDTRTAEPGGVRVFFANGLVFGDNVAVRTEGSIEPTAKAIAQIEEVGKLAAAKPLEERIASADAVVNGRVVGLRAAEKQTAPKSEHDPDWWIANVLVLSTIHGRKIENEIEVLFANSTDIAWYKAPKLHSGQSGLLLLHKLNAAQSPPAVARRIFQVIEPLDFLPIERVEDVKLALQRVKGH
jgi:hypothetical protein